MRTSSIAPILLAGTILSGVVHAADSQFIPLARDEDNMEARPGVWFAADLGTADKVLPLKTRSWATKESVTGGAALKCVFEPGSKALFAFELDAYPAGTAGLTLYAKASRPVKIKVNGATADVTKDWQKIDLTVAALGEITWRGILLGLADSPGEKTWLIIDRVGFETPAFNPKPEIKPQADPDQAISSKDMLYGTENLAKVAAKFKAKQPFKIIAIGDSITAGVQINRSSPGIGGATNLPYHYFARLATLLEEGGGYKGITYIQHGKGGTATLDGLGVVENPVATEAEAGDLVILEYGANDMGGRGDSPDTWKAHMKTLIAKVRSATKTDQIIVMSPTVGGEIPAKAAGITKALKELCKEEKVAGADITLLSMYRGEAYAWAFLANQYHPSIGGHLLMAEMMAPILTGKHVSYPE